MRVQRRLAADTRPSVRSNCTIGLPSAMYSMILFMVDLSFISLATSGFTQTSAVFSISSNSRPDAPGKGHVFIDARARALSARSVVELRATADQS